MTDAQWDSLLIPIGLAFFLKSSTEDRVLAMYPGPAGSAESLLSLDTWTDIVQENPVLDQMEADVEALLVNRLNRAAEYYLDAHRQVLSTGGSDPLQLARAVGRHRSMAEDRRLLRRVERGSHA